MLLLVVGSLVEVGHADAVHDVDALLEAADGVAEVICEVEILLVGLDLLEADDLQFGAFQVQLNIDDLRLQTLDRKIDFGSGAESG